MTMKILVLSDLHNDHTPFNPVVDGVRVDKDADLVVLAGDTDEGVKGIAWARQAFPSKRILFIAGNHEFYGKEWHALIADLRAAGREHGVDFMENDELIVDGVRFLGATLWTDFLYLGESRKDTAIMAVESRAPGQGMTDFKRVKVKEVPTGYTSYRYRRLKAKDTIVRHKRSVRWLEERLDAAHDGPTVVVTHHAPYGRSVTEGYENHHFTPAYVSNLHDLVWRPTVWIHGHMHHSVDYPAGDGRVLANPRGYESKEHMPNENFDPFKLIEV